MSDNTLNSLRRLTGKFDEAGEKMNTFFERQRNGEKPDPKEFASLLEKRSITQSAMSAQFKLFEKPMKTVLQETK
jgi:hypothetical protein